MEGQTFQEYAAITEGKELEQTKEEFWKLEKEYWSYVDNQIGDPVTVEYAADLAVTTFGSGFGRKG